MKTFLKSVYSSIAKFSPSLADEFYLFLSWLYGTVLLLCGLCRRTATCRDVVGAVAYVSDLLIDVSHCVRTPVNTGIQRTARRLAGCAPMCCLTAFNGASFVRVSAPYPNGELDGRLGLIHHGRNAKFLILDMPRRFSRAFAGYIKKVRNAGGQSFCIVYDMLPVKYPELFENYDVCSFKRWHDMIFSECDNVVCISRTVADDVIAYFRQSGFKRIEPLKVFHFPLGADVTMHHRSDAACVRSELRDFVNDRTFLMVGTVEPRKGHTVALKAFSDLHSSDVARGSKLLILGRNGWKNDVIIKAYADCRAHGVPALWIDDASDDELVWAYMNCCALIAASRDEGYGLPLVEAAQHGLPLICSDIPVFREVSQGCADFFKVLDSNDLANVLTEWLSVAEHPDSSGIRLCSWQESADALFAIVNGRTGPYAVLH